MLYFMNTKTRKQLTWHIGGKIYAEHLRGGEFNLVQADGDELDYIKSNFSNVPLSSCRVNVWENDFAKFIVRNFPMKTF